MSREVAPLVGLDERTIATRFLFGHFFINCRVQQSQGSSPNTVVLNKFLTTVAPFRLATMLPSQDYQVTRQQMHGKSSEERNALLSLLQKDSRGHEAVTREYVERWNTDGHGDDKDIEAGRETRKGEYMSLVNK